MTLARADGDSNTNFGLAKEICECLTFAYPNHSWWVDIRGGIVFVKHFAISGKIGMAKPLAKLDHDATTRKKEVIRMAGELLERAHLRRGSNHGDPVTTLEGGAQYNWRPPITPVPGV